MAYWGGYPEPMNDPEYDKNSDDITFKELGFMFCSLIIFGCLICLFSTI